MNIQQIPTAILRRWIRGAKKRAKEPNPPDTEFFRFNNNSNVFSLKEIKAELERRCSRELELMD